MWLYDEPNLPVAIDGTRIAIASASSEALTSNATGSSERGPRAVVSMRIPPSRSLSRQARLHRTYYLPDVKWEWTAVCAPP
jgi:hypothetical protein